MNKSAGVEEIQFDAESEYDSSQLLDGILENKTKVEKKENKNTIAHSIKAEITGFDEEGYAIVAFANNNQDYELTAESTVELKYEHVGNQCLVTFEDGRVDKPVITGIYQSPIRFGNVEGVDKPVIIKSKAGIVLKSGSSIIELTEDGTIFIQGMHIHSQAYGPNRIKGGSVKIN